MISLLLYCCGEKLAPVYPMLPCVKQPRTPPCPDQAVRPRFFLKTLELLLIPVAKRTLVAYVHCILALVYLLCAALLLFVCKAQLHTLSHAKAEEYRIEIKHCVHFSFWLSTDISVSSFSCRLKLDIHQTNQILVSIFAHFR